MGVCSSSSSSPSAAGAYGTEEWAPLLIGSPSVRRAAAHFGLSEADVRQLYGVHFAPRTSDVNCMPVTALRAFLEDGVDEEDLPLASSTSAEMIASSLGSSPNPWLQHMLASADVLRATVTFAQFLTIVSEFAIKDEDALVRFAFDAFDMDKDGRVSSTDLRRFLKAARPAVGYPAYAVSRLAAFRDLSLDLSQFREFHETNAMFVWPVLRLQRRLQSATLGIEVWQRKMVAFMEKRGRVARSPTVFDAARVKALVEMTAVEERPKRSKSAPFAAVEHEDARRRGRRRRRRRERQGGRPARNRRQMMVGAGAVVSMAGRMPVRRPQQSIDVSDDSDESEASQHSLAFDEDNEDNDGTGDETKVSSSERRRRQARAARRQTDPYPKKTSSLTRTRVSWRKPAEPVAAEDSMLGSTLAATDTVSVTRAMPRSMSHSTNHKLRRVSVRNDEQRAAELREMVAAMKQSSPSASAAAPMKRRHTLFHRAPRPMNGTSFATMRRSSAIKP